MIAYSASTKFWNSNNSERITTYDSMLPNMDEVKVLKANARSQPDCATNPPKITLPNELTFNVLGLELTSRNLPDAGQKDYHRLSLIYEDANGDKIPDRTTFNELFKSSFSGKPSDFYDVGTSLIDLFDKTGMNFINSKPFGTSADLTLDAFEEFNFRINGKVFLHRSQPGIGTSSGYWKIDTSQSNEPIVSKIVTVLNGGPIVEVVPDTLSVISVIPGAAGTGKFTILDPIAPINPMRYIIPGCVLRVTDLLGNEERFFTVRSATEDPSNSSRAIITVRETISSSMVLELVHNKFELSFNSMIYFKRDDILSEYYLADDSENTRMSWLNDVTQNAQRARLYKRFVGRKNLNFAWFHRTPRYNLVNPSATNIIDMFILTKGYFTSVKRWLSGHSSTYPVPPTPLELKTSYAKFVDNKMISDTLVMHPGKIKLIFGSKAIPELQATLKIIRPTVWNISDIQFKVLVRDAVREFFDLDKWEFGETFYFTELAARVHSALGSEIDSVVLVPKYSTNQFGDLFQVTPMEDEILYADINVSDIEIVPAYTSINLRQ